MIALLAQRKCQKQAAAQLLSLRPSGLEKEHSLRRRDRLHSDAGFPLAAEPQAQFTHHKPLSSYTEWEERQSGGSTHTQSTGPTPGAMCILPRGEPLGPCLPKGGRQPAGGTSSWEISEHTAQPFQQLIMRFLKVLLFKKQTNQSLINNVPICIM